MKNIPIYTPFLVAMLGLGLVPATASAESAPAATAPAPNKLDPAWVEMERRVTTLAGQDKQRQMLDLAYATVAAEKCQGLKVDGKTINDEFHVLAEDTQKSRNPDEQRQFEIELSVAFGTYIGLVLAEGLQDLPAFCQEVEAVKARNGGPAKYWGTSPAKG